MLRNVMGNTRMKFVAGAILMSLASVAAAQSLTLRGGGATLPALGYTGDNANALLTPISGSLLGAYTANGNPGTTYCPTGSGGGKKILSGDPSVPVTATCLGTPGGFSGDAGMTQPHFVGSDSPLSTTDFASYQSFRGTSKVPVQFPAVAGAIAVAFNKSGVSSLNLTESQICRVFSGNIKTWQDLSAAGAVGIPAGTTGNITIISRVDGSGTSFNFSNHLSAMCGASHLNVATSFETNQDFQAAVAAYSANYAAKATASGNTNVVNLIGTTDGAIGYAEVANVVVGSPAKFANVENVNATGTFINPSTYGSPLTVNISYDKAIGSNVAGRPTLVSLPTTTQCIGVVDPSDYATPASGYPIVAVSYLLGNAQDNTGTGVLTAVRRVLFAPWNSSIRSNTLTIGPNTGFAFLADAAGGMTQSKINACVN